MSTWIIVALIVLALVVLLIFWPGLDMPFDEAMGLMTKYKPPGWKPREPGDGESG